jgi:lysophospholipase L1-like esterase
LSLGVFDSSVLERQSIVARFEHFSPVPQQLTLQVQGGPLDGQSHHDGGATGVGVDVIGSYIGIELSHRDAAQWNSQLFSDNLAQCGAGPSALSRQLALPVVNAGRRGDTTADALERLSDAVLSKNPRLVILLLGGNDFLRQRPRQETRTNLEEIVQRVQAQGAIVAIAGIKLGLFTDEYGEIFEQTAEKFGALYIPQVMKGSLGKSSLKSDPIHPNGAGYRLIAERIAERIKPLLHEADRLRIANFAG